MKFNWGIGITIAIVLFMSYILLMVFKATSTTQHLQAEDYYAQEIGYQEKINALRLGDSYYKMKLTQKGKKALVELPKDFESDDSQIEVALLRPNDSALDLSFSVPLHKPEIDGKKLIPGAYRVTLSWVHEGQKHATESSFSYK